MIAYLENTKASTNKLPELITSEFSKVAGYKINIQNSTVFLYASNEQQETEILKTVPFTIVPKKEKPPEKLSISSNICERSVHWSLQNNDEQNQKP